MKIPFIVKDSLRNSALRKLKFRHFIIGSILIIFFLSAFQWFIVFKNQHHVKWDGYNKYLWVFSDSVRQNIDSVYFVGLERKSNNLYEYIVNQPGGKHYVTILDFKKPIISDLDSAVINLNSDLESIRVYTAERFNSEKNYIRPEIIIESEFSFDDGININLNDKSRVSERYCGKDFRVFFGEINKMSLSNKNEENIILMDYGTRVEKTLFALFNYERTTYFILLNSESEIDKSAINVFNFN